MFGLLAALLVAPTVRQVYGIAGLEGTFEFGLDAPWRMEPSKKSDGTLEYGAIPIQITIHGARDAALDDVMYTTGGAVRLPEFLVSLGTFYSVRIKELGPTETTTVEFPITSLHEIELMLGAWPYPHNPSAQPQYRICRLWKGENPDLFRAVYNTSEWHATLYYVPRNNVPGTSVALQIEVLLQRFPWPNVQTPAGQPVTVDVSPFVTLRNYARVYLAPEPLPRFDRRWLYGDLHYHSQGTDNEGEAGYNYRGVVRALGAMGLDFVFATDHASSSEQIIDADLPPVHKIVETAHAQGDVLKEKDVRSRGGVLRDMNASKFEFCHYLIYGPNGANQEASVRAGQFRLPQNYHSYGVMPQIFLGAEVDAVPEVRAATVDSFVPPGTIKLGLPYGNGLVFDLGRLCAPMGCDDPRQALLRFGDAESYLVRDFQSLESFDYFGRLHLVYFPNSSSLQVGNETTFVPSYTSRFGGATRRLDRQFQPAPEFAMEPLLPEVERKGVTFIAHHLNAGGGRGPDGVPWTTDHMLLRAFRSRAVLGLEFWNEDTRYRTRVCSHDYCRPNGGSLGVFLGQERGYERYEKLEAETGNPFIDLLLKFLASPGIEYNALPGEFRHLALPLEEVRRGFITGGPGGSQFELQPFDVLNGYWQESSDEVDHTLHHGAYDWDIMNLRGLAFEENTDLVAPRGWLQPGEPRRMFMAGGSDAHGDFNYRRAGYFLGTEDANDTAIGKPRNLVLVGPPEGPVIYHEEPQVADSDIIGNSPPPSSGDARQIGLASLSRNIPGIIKPPVDSKPPVNDPIRDPILDPIRDPGTKPPIDPKPPVDPSPDVTPDIKDPILDPDPTDPVPPTDPRPDVTPDIKDPILDPTPTDPKPPIDPRPDVTPDIKDPILDPGAGDPPPTPPIRPPFGGGEANLGLTVRAHTHEQVVRALRNGRFCVTDGPAIRIAIDLNGNEIIDDSDVQMGDVHRIAKLAGSLAQSQTITLLTEVVSTSEFGPITDIDVYVGAQPTAPAGGTPGLEPRLYAPLRHGPAGFSRDAMASPQVSYQSHNRTYVRQEDRYWNGEFLGDKLTWNHTSGDALRYQHTLVTTLTLDKYEVGRGVTADRFFVRAFAFTAGNATRHIPNRYAFSNPIWVLRSEPAVAPPDDPLNPPPGGGDAKPPPDQNPSPSGGSTPPPAPGANDAPRPLLTTLRTTDGRIVLSFEGTLQRTRKLGEPFTDVPGVINLYLVPMEDASSFFRARR